jgi:molybdopterin-synthase adenylyltransferase
LQKKMQQEKTKNIFGRKQAELAARYARQIALPEIGEEGQKKIGKSSVLIVGLGGLGSPAALYLSAAGIGAIGIVDDDRVDATNLQRQILYIEKDIGSRKVVMAQQRLADQNRDAKIRIIAGRFDRRNGLRMARSFDFVIDATDNAESKFLIAETCHRARVPYSHAGVRGFYGQAMTVLPGKTACPFCLFEDVPAPAQGVPKGPLGPVPGIFGSVQALEAIKHITGCGRLLTNRILTWDTLSMTARIVEVERSERCRICGSLKKGGRS